MKTLIVLTSLFAAQMSFAMPAQTICRTKYMGYDQRQITVYLFFKPTHAEATVIRTSTTGIYRPMTFSPLSVYGINGAVSYVSQDPMMSTTPRFNLTLRGNNKGTLMMGNSQYEVSCVNAREPIVTL